MFFGAQNCCWELHSAMNHRDFESDGQLGVVEQAHIPAPGRVRGHKLEASLQLRETLSQELKQKGVKSLSRYSLTFMSDRLGYHRPTIGFFCSGLSYPPKLFSLQFLDF